MQIYKTPISQSQVENWASWDWRVISHPFSPEVFYVRFSEVQPMDLWNGVSILLHEGAETLLWNEDLGLIDKDEKINYHMEPQRFESCEALIQELHRLECLLRRKRASDTLDFHTFKLPKQ